MATQLDPLRASHLPLLSSQIDLDTIETSNLNRQFLFRRSHVGQSKAQVAGEVVKAFAPHANITAYQVGSGREGVVDSLSICKQLCCCVQGMS